jgi:hypothetical protein
MTLRQKVLFSAAWILALFAFMACASQERNDYRNDRWPAQPAHFSDPSYMNVSPSAVPENKWRPPKQ